MFRFLFIASLVVSSSHLVEGRTLNSKKIVNYINNLETNTWQADTYGSTEINVKQFVRARLGVKMIRRPPYPKKDGVFLTVDELEKANLAEPKSYISGADENLPKNFTWTNKSLTNCPIGNIRDQSNCGSCWAVSSAAAFSDRLCLKTNGTMTVPLSSNHVTACVDKNYGCSGGYMYYAYKFFKDIGLITGGEYDSDVGCQPYSIRPCGYPMSKKWPCPTPNAHNPKCKGTKCTNEWYPSKYEKKNYTISNSYYIGSSYNEYEIRRDIYENGPVTATFWVYEDFVYYKTGVYEHREGYWPLGGHAVRVVGWGEENRVKYWLVANSWGTDWGEDGFFKIKRGVNMCWFESDMQAVTPNVE